MASSHNKPYKILGRLVVWRNKTLARSNQGGGRRATRNNRIVVFKTHRSARRSIPAGIGG